jgi:hypothetical protein
MNWKKPSPKPSVSSLQTTQKPGSITASMVYSKTENALEYQGRLIAKSKTRVEDLSRDCWIAVVESGSIELVLTDRWTK